MRWPQGPKPLILRPAEVDALYDVLEELARVLDAASVQWTLICGSLLGAVRSESILFCDDDVDIAIIGGAEDLARARTSLSQDSRLLTNAYFAERPWPACDRVRPKAAPSVWIDVFCLRYFEARASLDALIARKANGDPQERAVLDAVERTLLTAATARDECGGESCIEDLFPLWHYDNFVAILQWPGEFFRDNELLPLQRAARFGPLAGLPMPHRPLHALVRHFGLDCFAVFHVATAHEAYRTGARRSQTLPSPACSAEVLRDRPPTYCAAALSAAGVDSQQCALHENRRACACGVLGPAGAEPPIQCCEDVTSGTQTRSAAAAAAVRKLALVPSQYLPVQHSRRHRRVWSTHSCDALATTLARMAEEELFGPPPRLSDYHCCGTGEAPVQS